MFTVPVVEKLAPLPPCAIVRSPPLMSIVPLFRCAALGFVNMVSVLGGAVFQPLIGWLLDLQWDGRLADGARVYAAETFRKAFIVLPMLYALAFVSGLRVRETFCRPYAAPAQPTRVAAEA